MTTLITASSHFTQRPNQSNTDPSIILIITAHSHSTCRVTKYSYCVITLPVSCSLSECSCLCLRLCVSLTGVSLTLDCLLPLSSVFLPQTYMNTHTHTEQPNQSRFTSKRWHSVSWINSGGACVFGINSNCVCKLFHINPLYYNSCPANHHRLWQLMTFVCVHAYVCVCVCRCVRVHACLHVCVCVCV